MELPELGYCFACGKNNPHGLHLIKKSEGDRAVMELTVNDNHTGYPGILHGGIMATMMDEVMTYAIFDQDKVAVTLSMSIDFTAPGKVGHLVKVEGWVEKMEGRDIEGASIATDPATGKCLAKAHGVYKVVDFERFASKI